MGSRRTIIPLLILLLPFLPAETNLTKAARSNSRAGNSSLICDKKERNALLTFKVGLKDTSNMLSSWVGENCRNWFGVGCSNRTGRVTKLDLHGQFVIRVPGRNDIALLSRKQLGDKLSPSLLDLKYLTYLDLSCNDFQRIPIPRSSTDWLQTVNMLPSLLELRLSTCSLDYFPESLPSLNFTSLSFLDLSSNKFSSLSIIQWLSNITTLTYLGFRWCDLRGPIPEVPRGCLCNLRTLDLSRNYYINGDLQEFVDAISGCGPVPPSIVNLSSLVELDLPFNKLSGMIPEGIGQLTSGVLPNSVNFSPGAQIDLGFNSLEGSLPLWPNATCLSLRINLLSGPIPISIGRGMPELQLLDLSRTFLNGSIPPSFREMSFLGCLDLSFNKLSGEISEPLMGLERLGILDLSNNSLSGKIPSEMCSQLPALNWLRLRGNSLSGDISTLFHNCTGLSALDLGENIFSGSIPIFIAPDLSLLSLRGNMLHGNIPKQLCRLRSLHIIDLANNNLSGIIPKCLGSESAALKNPKYFFVTPPSTQPEYFSQRSDLVVKGRLIEYTKIISLLLETLDLSWNHLSGRIPPSMSSMTSLNYLNFSHNNLSGPIPSANQFQTLNDPWIYGGNPDLCGPPLPTKCSSPSNDGNLDISNDRDQNADRSDNDHDTLWFYVSLALGYVVGFWTVCGALLINKSLRHAYFKVSRCHERKAHGIHCNQYGSFAKKDEYTIYLTEFATGFRRNKGHSGG
ncbi:Leucine-rich repeat domain containing protein [Parasponia andersonii]|uniref:Leucine-rich repeat domain containing protein n=1 Tax=Parasponia andersonii TaxID=3476 RepID=A0A2P5BPE0_PARAD|nr:Leucine-rich repeat domain containing protein [Parasponia andersonii]